MNSNAEGFTRKKKSLDTQQTGYSPRATKTDNYAKGHARKVLARNEQTPV